MSDRAACVIVGASAGAAIAYYMCGKCAPTVVYVPLPKEEYFEESTDVVQDLETEETESKAANGNDIERSTASSGVSPGGGPAIYETARAVNEYLAFHFLPPKVLLPYACGPKESLNFTKRCAELCKKNTVSQRTRVLDLGCATGGQSFELARHFKEVLGLDFSQAFVDAANMMKVAGKAKITIQTEGTLTVEREVHVPGDISRAKVRFIQGDACDLPSKHFGPFDCILCANLLCRLPRPMDLLERLPSLVRTGGVVVFVSPYSWLVEYTEKENWLGGLQVDGEPVHSADTLKRLMRALPFELVDEQDMPFLIREHARKFQWGCSHATVWRRKKDKNKPLN